MEKGCEKCHTVKKKNCQRYESKKKMDEYKKDRYKNREKSERKKRKNNMVLVLKCTVQFVLCI